MRFLSKIFPFSSQLYRYYWYPIAYLRLLKAFYFSLSSLKPLALVKSKAVSTQDSKMNCFFATCFLNVTSPNKVLQSFLFSANNFRAVKMRVCFPLFN